MLSVQWQVCCAEPSHESKLEWLRSNTGDLFKFIDWLLWGCALPATAIEPNPKKRSERLAGWPETRHRGERGKQGRRGGRVQAWSFRQAIQIKGRSVVSSSPETCPVHPVRSPTTSVGSTSDAVRQCSRRSSGWRGCSHRRFAHSLTRSLGHAGSPQISHPSSDLCLSVDGFLQALPCLTWMPSHLHHHHHHLHHHLPQLSRRAVSSWRSELDTQCFPFSFFFFLSLLRWMWGNRCPARRWWSCRDLCKPPCFTLKRKQKQVWGIYRFRELKSCAPHKHHEDYLPADI